jgi:hypothetical protein
MPFKISLEKDKIIPNILYVHVIEHSGDFAEISDKFVFTGSNTQVSLRSTGPALYLNSARKIQDSPQVIVSDKESDSDKIIVGIENILKDVAAKSSTKSTVSSVTYNSSTNVYDFSVGEHKFKFSLIPSLSDNKVYFKIFEQSGDWYKTSLSASSLNMDVESVDVPELSSDSIFLRGSNHRQNEETVSYRKLDTKSLVEYTVNVYNSLLALRDKILTSTSSQTFVVLKERNIYTIK